MASVDYACTKETFGWQSSKHKSQSLPACYMDGHANRAPKGHVHNKGCGGLENEIVRFATFVMFPLRFLSSLRLAKAGFYYCGHDDETECFSCGLRCKDWPLGVSPFAVHKENSPDCKFLLGQSDNKAVQPDFDVAKIAGESLSSPPTNPTSLPTQTGNTADKSSDSDQNETKTPTDSQIKDITKTAQENHVPRPKSPDMASLESRIDSFKHWPENLQQTPVDLSNAGFYYAGFSDCVRCFQCGGGLRNWEYGDEPWEEHARWFPDCAHVRQCKGDAYVEEQQRQLKQWQQASAATATSSTTVSSVLTAAAHNGNIAHSTCSVGNVSLDSRRKPKEEYARSDMPDRCVSENKIKTPSTLGHKKQASPTKKSCENIKTKEVLTEENRKLKEQMTCKICMDDDACVVFLPCSHMVSCPQCAPALRKCPICRKLIKGVVRAYLT